jgi:zeaxanthin glucosyltransferase
MSVIAILVDFYEGHILPTIRLARAIRDRGHRVSYLGIPDTADTVRAQGFDFIEVLGDVLPAGSARRLRRLAGRDLDNQKLMNIAQELYFGPLATGKAFDESMARLRPDVMIVLSFFTAEALAIRYRYGIPVIFLTPFIRQQRRADASRVVIERMLDLKSGVADVLRYIQQAGIRLRNLADIVDLILLMPDLTLIPEGFELPDSPRDPDTHYIGAGVDLDRVEPPFPWESIDSSRPIVYASLGSQPDVYGETGCSFFRLMMEAASLRTQWQFIISVGGKLDLDMFGSATDQIHICDWAPQLAILSRAAFMVTHGGMGTVKECILMGVPMLVFPLLSDSVRTARRVVHHGLGLHAKLERTDLPTVLTLMDRLATEDSFRHSVAKMRESFLRGENLPLAVEVIERAATRKSEAETVFDDARERMASAREREVGGDCPIG